MSKLLQSVVAQIREATNVLGRQKMKVEGGTRDKKFEKRLQNIRKTR